MIFFWSRVSGYNNTEMVIDFKKLYFFNYTQNDRAIDAMKRLHLSKVKKKKVMWNFMFAPNKRRVVQIFNTSPSFFCLRFRKE